MGCECHFAPRAELTISNSDIRIYFGMIARANRPDSEEHDLFNPVTSEEIVAGFSILKERLERAKESLLDGQVLTFDTTVH